MLIHQQRSRYQFYLGHNLHWKPFGSPGFSSAAALSTCIAFGRSSVFPALLPGTFKRRRGDSPVGREPFPFSAPKVIETFVHRGRFLENNSYQAGRGSQSPEENNCRNGFRASRSLGDNVFQRPRNPYPLGTRHSLQGSESRLDDCLSSILRRPAMGGE